MKTKVIVLVSLAGFGFAVWLARGGDTPHGPAGAAAAEPAAVTGSGGNGAHTWFAASAPSTASAAPVRKLDPRGERFRKRVDDQIPARLYGEASHCYKGGGGRDERLDLTYHIRVRDGAVTIGGIKRSDDSTLQDGALERCIRDRLSSLSWHEDELPDFEEDDDLFMRVAGWKAYLANAEADDEDNGGGGAVN